MRRKTAAACRRTMSRGVNLIITDAGHMTLSVVSDGAVWSVFGHALPDERAVSAEQSIERSTADETRASEPRHGAAP